MVWKKECRAGIHVDIPTTQGIVTSHSIEQVNLVVCREKTVIIGKFTDIITYTFEERLCFLHPFYL